MKKQAVLFVLIFTSVLATGVVISAEPAAGFLGLFGGDDPWQPPDRGYAQDDLTDKEYLALWGRTSSALEDAETPEEQIEILKKDYDGFVETPKERTTYLGFFQNGATTDEPQDIVQKWNNGLYSLDTEGGDPIRGEKQHNRPQITNSYYQIVRPSPHTIYATDTTKTKYVGEQVQLNSVHNFDYQSRDGEFNGADGVSYFYWISDVEFQNFTVTAESNGDVLDKQDIGHPTSPARLSLRDAEHGDNITFTGSGEFFIEETIQYYEMNCVEKDSYSYSIPGGGNRTVSYCVDWEKNVLNESVATTKTVSVEDEITGYTRYNPTVDIAYDAETRDGKKDLYYLNMQSDAPIAGVYTGSESINFGYSFVAARDKSYDDKLGDVTPVNHYAIPSGSKASADSIDSNENFVVYQSSGTPVSDTPSEIDDVVLGFNESDTQTKITRVVGSGNTPVARSFDKNKIRGESIIPGDEGLDVNFTESDFNITATDLNVQFEAVGDGYNQSVDATITEDVGEPLNTSNRSDMYIRVRNSGNGYDERFNSTGNGSVEEFVVPAQPGHRIVVEFVHEFDPDDDETLYTAQKETKSITPNILYGETTRALMFYLVTYFINYFLPVIIPLSLVYYGFTGRFLPPAVKDALKVWK